MGFSEYPFPVAVKTGTSSRYRDAWTVAWSERYLVGVWVGHPDERPMSALSGYRLAARLAQTLLERLHRDELDGLSGRSFPPPAGERSERLCALTGARATPACDRVVLEWLPADAPPLSDCRAHRQVGVDRRTGALATAATPAGEIEPRTFVDLPTRYAAWLLHQGLPGLPEALSDAARRADGAVLELAGALPKVAITSPEPGSRVLRDPETPRELNTLRLAAAVDPPVPQLVWYVDGRPFATVERPYALRWRLEPGEHVFQARVPFSQARSPLVRITVE
jgi:penicillin-binding protein 1C